MRQNLELLLHQLFGLVLVPSLLLVGLDCVLLLLEVGFQLLPVLLVHLLEGGVVAAVVDQLSILEMQHIGADGVKEVGVVGDHDDGMWVDLRQVVVQPKNSIQVQVIRGLIQHQELGLQEKGLRETDAHSPASGELHHRPVHGEAVLVDRAVAEAEAAEDLSDLRLRDLGARGLEVDGDLLQLVAAALEVLHGDLLALIGLVIEVIELLQQILLLLEQIRRLDVRSDDLLNGGSIGGLGLLLHEDTIPIDGHGHVASSDVPQNCGLAHAVGAEDAVPLALDDGDAGVGEQGLSGSRQREVVADEGVPGGRRLEFTAFEGQDECLEAARVVPFLLLAPVILVLLKMPLVHPLILVREFFALLDLV
mmetsp:Transcript_173203/g.555491  ORF Transcript_173203/g.555491 Transcript_173203/m.555491 type:complete len:364 (-) Transcript_173203:1053-2144(-)